MTALKQLQEMGLQPEKSGLQKHTTIMKKPEKLDSRFIPIYNDFVEAVNDGKILFQNLSLFVGITEDGKEGLGFEIETTSGLTDAEAQGIFKGFIAKHPQCSINYNKREESALEKAILEMGGKVITMDEGYQLTRIER